MVETNVLKAISITGSKQKIYVLVDLFCFYHLRSFDDINNGYAFEILALNNIELLLKEAKLKSKDINLYRWHNKKAQIDLIVDHQDKINYSLFECKFYNKQYEINEDEKDKILNRKSEFIDSLSKKKALVDLIVFSMFGTKNRTTLNYFDLSLNEILDIHLLSLRN